MEASIRVDIAFQEGESTDLFIGWLNKRDGGVWGYRMFLYHLLNYYCIVLSTVASKIP